MIPTDLWARLTAPPTTPDPAALERLLTAERQLTARLRQRIAVNHPGGQTTSSPGESW